MDNSTDWRIPRCGTMRPISMLAVVMIMVVVVITQATSAVIVVAIGIRV